MSFFQKAVCLKEWWLVKTDKDYDGRRLAVAGITSGEKLAVRVFSSAPILRRYDVFTLETVDGICVIIQGFINKTLTEDNGFSSEVFKHFVFGFPAFWETFSKNCFEEYSALTGDAQSNSGLERSPRQAASSSKGTTKNFNMASNESEIQECSKEKNLDMKSSLESEKKDTKYNPGHGEARSAFDSNACDVSGRETSFGDYSVEDGENFVLSGSQFNVITAKSLTSPGLEKKSDLPFIKNSANDTKNENYIGKKFSLKTLQEHCRNSSLSACRLRNERGCSNSLQSPKDPSQVNSSERLAKQFVFSRQTGLSEEPSSCPEVRGTAYFRKKVQGKSKNHQMSSTKLKDERIMSVSALKCSNSVGNPRANPDRRPSGTSTLNPLRDEFQELTDQLDSRNPDVKSFEDIVELDHGVCLDSKRAEHDEAHDRVQENGAMQNKSDGYRTLSDSIATSSLESGKKGTKYNPGHEEARSAFDSNACDVSGRETSFGDYSVEDGENFVLPGSQFNVITAKSLTSPGLEKKSDLPFIKNSANDTKNENYIGKKFSLKTLKEHCRNSSLSACRLRNERGCSNSLLSPKDPSQVNSSERLAKQFVFSRQTGLSEEPSSCPEVRGTAYFQKKVQGQSKNHRMSSTKLKDERIMSVSALKCSNSVGNPRANPDRRPSGGTSTLNPLGDEFQELTDQLDSRNPDVKSFEDNVELDRGVCLDSKYAEHDEAHDRVQENGAMQNESDGYRTLSGSIADKEKRKRGRSNSRTESLSQRKSTRKIDGLVSEKEKEVSSIMTPESLCLRKSRAGRWLLPTLEFWRNQTVIYDADHQISGIKDMN